MFDYIKGKVTDIGDNYVTILNNNIGYKVLMKNTGFIIFDDEQIYIYEKYCDPEYVLYGFKTKDERDFFQKLLLVNGIGPKIALTIMDNCSINRLIFYIKNKRLNELSNIRGVGNKGNNIINELSNKLGQFDNNIFEYDEVGKALKSLGYKEDAINFALGNLKSGLTLEEALKNATRSIKNEY